MYETGWNLCLLHPFRLHKLHSYYKQCQLLSVPLVYHAVDNSEFVISIFLNFTKAFDLVNMSYLLRKLYLYEIRNIEN